MLKTVVVISAQYVPLLLKISLLDQEQSQITQDRNFAVGRYALSTNESAPIL